MSIFSLYFLAFFCTVALLFHARPSRLYRQRVLTAANAVFLAAFLSAGWNVGILVGVVLVSYLSLLVLKGRPTPPVLVACILTAVAALIFVKRYAFLDALLPDALLRHSIELIGISYITFKYIHVAVDLRQNQVRDIELLPYLNYQLGFFSLLAGPIQRYNDFAEYWNTMDGAAADLRSIRQWRRTLIGLLKMGVLGSLALLLYEIGIGQITGGSGRLQAATGLALVFYAYPLYVYLNFSGYCDAVIGAAGVLGMKQQENFDRPLIARNVLDFWNRWHISLTLWIRDYIFTPLYKSAATRWRGRAGALGYAALFLALLTAGVWHGATWNFVAFGALHGAGVVTVQVYGDALRRRLGRQRLKLYLANPAVRFAAILVTLHFVCATFIFFRPGLRDSVALLYHAGRQLL